jgi:hypothetical protein
MNSIFHKITVVPGVIGTSDNECEKLESPWRDSALTEIGCDSGNNGIDRIKTVLIQCGLMSHILYHFAYANHQHLVIEYKNGSWGPNNIGGIFAYGTCRINGNAGNCLEIKNGSRKKKSI